MAAVVPAEATLDRALSSMVHAFAISDAPVVLGAPRGIGEAAVGLANVAQPAR